MTEQFGQDMLIKAVAQICQMVGFKNTMTSPLYTLVDILKMFICRLGQTAHRYAEHCGRSSPNLTDLSLAFHDFGVRPTDLVDFLEYVSPLPHSLLVPKYPVSRKTTIMYCLQEQSSTTNKVKKDIPVKVHPEITNEARMPTGPESSLSSQCHVKKEPIKLTISLKNIKTVAKSKKNSSKRKKKKRKTKK